MTKPNHVCDYCWQPIIHGVDLTQLDGDPITDLHVKCWREIGEPFSTATYRKIKPLPVAMSRIDAESVIAPYVQSKRGATCLIQGEAYCVLGPVRYYRLEADPIRKHGPEPGYIYSWNVVDYLVNPDLRAEKKHAGQSAQS